LSPDKMLFINKFPRFVNFIFFSFSILIIVARYPGYLSSPRMWAEEFLYYETFLNSLYWWEGFDAIMYPAYYVASTRLAAFIAANFDLEYAPLITTISGLAVLAIPLTILFFTNATYWKSLKSKLILSSFIIFSCSTGEIWLNSTTTHFIFPVAAFLILLDDNLQNKFKIIYYSFILILGVLSGPITLLMSPFFFFRYLKGREKAVLWFCGIFLIFGIIQILFFLVSSQTGVLNLNRGNNINLEFFNRFYYWISPNLIFPIFGYFASLIFRNTLLGINSESELAILFAQMQSALPDNAMNVIEPVLSSLFLWSQSINFLFLALVLLIIFREYKKSCNDEKIYFLSLFLYFSFITNYLSLGGHGGFRYSFLTGFVLLFYIYQQFFRSRKKFNRGLAKGIISLSIIIGLIEYYPRVVSYTPETLSAKKVDWPKWETEIMRWEEDSSYKPKIWPYIKEKDGFWPQRSTIYSVNMSEQESWYMEGGYRFSEEIRKKLKSKKDN